MVVVGSDILISDDDFLGYFFVSVSDSVFSVYFLFLVSQETILRIVSARNILFNFLYTSVRKPKFNHTLTYHVQIDFANPSGLYPCHVPVFALAYEF